MDRTEPLQALPDLTLGKAASRWGVSSANAIGGAAAPRIEHPHGLAR